MLTDNLSRELCGLPNETNGPYTIGFRSTDGFPRGLFIYYESVLNVRIKTMLLKCPTGQSHGGTDVTCTRDQTPLVTLALAQLLRDLVQ